MAQKMKALDELVVLMYHTPHLITKFGVAYPPNSAPPRGARQKKPVGQPHGTPPIDSPYFQPYSRDANSP